MSNGMFELWDTSDSKSRENRELLTVLHCQGKHPQQWQEHIWPNVTSTAGKPHAIGLRSWQNTSWWSFYLNWGRKVFSVCGVTREMEVFIRTVLGVLLLWVNTVISKLRRKGFIWLMLPHWRKSEQEPGGRSQGRVHGRVLPTDLLFIACSACSLLEPRRAIPEVPLPTMSGPTPIYCQLRKCPTAGSYVGIFSTKVPPSQVTIACVPCT